MRKVWFALFFPITIELSGDWQMDILHFFLKISEKVENGDSNQNFTPANAMA